MNITYQARNPFGLPELKAHMRVEHDVEDDVIARYADAAVSYYETATGLYLRTTEFSMRFTESPIELVTRPWVSVETAVDDDDAAITTTLRDAPGGVKVVEWDSTGSGALTMTWRVGASNRGAVPHTAAQAVRAMVADMYVNRQMEQPAQMSRSWLNQSIFLGESRNAV